MRIHGRKIEWHPFRRAPEASKPKPAELPVRVAPTTSRPTTRDERLALPHAGVGVSLVRPARSLPPSLAAVPTPVLVPAIEAFRNDLARMVEEQRALAYALVAAGCAVDVACQVAAAVPYDSPSMLYLLTSELPLAFKRATPGTPDDLIRAAKVMGKYWVSAEMLPDAFAIAELSEPKLGALLARAVSERAFDAEAPCSDAGDTIDFAHTLAPAGTDAIRSAYIAGLSEAGLMRELARNNPFTSTFLMALARLNAITKDKPLSALVEQTSDDTSADVVLNLARFRCTELLEKNASLFLLPALKLVQKDRSNMGMLIPFFLVAHEDPSVAAELERRLVELTALKDNVDLRIAGKFALRVLYENGAAMGEEAAALAQTFPPLPSAAPNTKQWLADGAMTAQLFFYPDETSFEKAVEYFGAQGFTAKQSTNDTVTYERVKNGVVQRVKMTKSTDPELRIKAQADPAIDIIVHRGHSYHFDSTFVGGALSPGKLVIGGSCGSYGAMVFDNNFHDAYQSALWMGDANRGEGSVNNPLILALLNGGAQGKTTWADFGLKSFEKKGFVLPTDYAFAFSRYSAQANASGL